jgi:hypothetical protein
MSILRLATEVVERDAGNAGATPAPPPKAVQLQPTAVQNALAILTKYIPTEIVTIYVPAVGVAEALKYTKESIYVAFLLLTPVILFLVLQGQRKANGLALLTWATAPVWRFFAATVAFAVWGLSVPSPPFLSETEGALIAGFAAMAVSTLLSLIEPLVEK